MLTDKSKPCGKNSLQASKYVQKHISCMKFDVFNISLVSKGSQSITESIFFSFLIVPAQESLLKTIPTRFFDEFPKGTRTLLPGITSSNKKSGTEYSNNMSKEYAVFSTATFATVKLLILCPLSFIIFSF